MRSLRRWTFTTKRGPERVQRELRRAGSVWCRAPELVAAVEDAPWAAITELFGERPARVEVRRIKDYGQPRYIEGSGAAGWHTDQHHGTFPPVQVWFCVRQARSGGESLLVDTWPLVQALAARDRTLYRQLFDVPRHLRFPDLGVYRPTFVLEHGTLVCTYPSVLAPDDAVGPRFHELVDNAPSLAFRLAAGDILVNHNHRVLHGRAAFGDPKRELLRVHVWFARPLPAPRALVARARAALADKPTWATAANYRVPDPEAALRLGMVIENLAMLRDHPTVHDFAERTGVPEERVARWREQSLAAALAELERLLAAERSSRASSPEKP